MELALHVGDDGLHKWVKLGAGWKAWVWANRRAIAVDKAHRRMDEALRGENKRTVNVANGVCHVGVSPAGIAIGVESAVARLPYPSVAGCEAERTKLA